MTRYTNIGLKRTYVQAGFNYREDEEAAGPLTASATETQTPLNDIEVNNQLEKPEGPAKKKRKRGKPKNRDHSDKPTEDAASGGAGEANEAVGGDSGQEAVKAGSNTGEKGTSKSVSKKAKAKARAKSQGA